MQAFAKTDIGCVRKVNQDVCYVSTDPVGPFPNLFIVADGMGGHKAGDYAARFAISTFLEFASGTEDRNLIHVVNEGIREANQRVLDKAQEDPERFGGMGTTLVAAFIEGRQLYVANVGDSRLYLVSQEEINQVTEDHSYVAAMVRAHEITPEEARNHPRKNVITRAVGTSGDVEADFFEVDLYEGDRILMCSDGLSNMIEDDQLRQMLSQGDVVTVTEKLIETARENGGLDNITAIVIDPELEEVNE